MNYDPSDPRQVNRGVEQMRRRIADLESALRNERARSCTLWEERDRFHEAVQFAHDNTTDVILLGAMRDALSESDD